MTTPLFLEPPTNIYPKVKHANVQLSEDHNRWAPEILNELFRTVPDTSEYSPSVTVLRANEEQGFAMGVVTINAHPDSSLAVHRVPGAQQANSVMVPFFIKNYIAAAP